MLLLLLLFSGRCSLIIITGQVVRLRLQWLLGVGFCRITGSVGGGASGLETGSVSKLCAGVNALLYLCPLILSLVSGGRTGGLQMA